jgi:hypothetical protein
MPPELIFICLEYKGKYDEETGLFIEQLGEHITYIRRRSSWAVLHMTPEEIDTRLNESVIHLLSASPSGPPVHGRGQNTLGELPFKLAIPDCVFLFDEQRRIKDVKPGPGFDDPTADSFCVGPIPETAGIIFSGELWTTTHKYRHGTRYLRLGQGSISLVHGTFTEDADEAEPLFEMFRRLFDPI